MKLREEPLAAGETVAGRYVIERVVAEGGFGIVVAAKHVELDEMVAIKFLKPEHAHQPDVVGRFAREAKACASIRSEHTPIVYDVGVSTERGPYIVMEYLEGEDLLALVNRRGALPVEYATELALQACEAIVAAHAKGVVHRDIKPENLFLARRPHGPEVLKVLDFGISKAVLSGEVFGTKLSLLKTQNLVGTPLYMSPEQLRGKGDVGPASDVWSLGAVLYELVTGDTAFGGTSITEVCATVLEAEPRPFDALKSEVPPGFADVVMKCLRKKAEDRFGGVAELAAALAPFAPERAKASVERTIAIARSAGLACPAEAKPEPLALPEPIADALPEPIAEAHADALPEPIAEAHADALPEPIAEAHADALPEPIAVALAEARADANVATDDVDADTDAQIRQIGAARRLRVVIAAATLGAVAIAVVAVGLLAGSAERNGTTVRDTEARDDADETVSTPVLRLPAHAVAAAAVAATTTATATATATTGGGHPATVTPKAALAAVATATATATTAAVIEGEPQVPPASAAAAAEAEATPSSSDPSTTGE